MKKSVEKVLMGYFRTTSHSKIASMVNPGKKVQKLSEDIFIHFTTRKNADKILSDGKLLKNPPESIGPGIEGVQAISLVWGRHVPNVQTNRLVSKYPKEDVVALKFKTNEKPSYGYVEEVIWNKDVPLIDPKVISLEDGIKQLKSAPNRIEEDTEVTYI